MTHQSGDIAVATIIAKNYLAHARVLVNSVRRFHPNIPLFVLLIDRADGYFDPSSEAVPFLEYPAARIHGSSVKQIASAGKPYLLETLLGQGFHTVLFLDPDVQVLGDLEPLFSQAAQHSITLTPHFVRPPETEDSTERELHILQSGVFNAGCVGVTNTPSGRRFLAWWEDRVENRCAWEVASGLYFDQRWLDLAPVYFDDVVVVRDPSYNIAYWNLPERDVDQCRFFHFSGFDPDRPDRLTRYASLDMSSAGAAARLFADYAELLRTAGHDDISHWPFGGGA